MSAHLLIDHTTKLPLYIHYIVAGERVSDEVWNIVVARLVHIMACRCLHQAKSCLDVCTRRLAASVLRWKSFVLLYLMTFLVVLPLMFHNMTDSIYFHQGETAKEAQERIRLDNNARLDWSMTYLSTVNRTRDVPEARMAHSNHLFIDVAIMVVTVSRNRQLFDSYKPRYLSQVVAKLLAYWHDAKVHGFHYNISLSVCNVDPDPDSYIEAQQLSGIIDIFNRFKKRYTTLTIRREKEKEDYIFCLNQSLAIYRPRYVFLIEDDALPQKNMFSVLQHVIGKHLDKKFVHGRLVTSTDDVTYVKFFHPKWLLSYYSIEPERIPGLLAFGTVTGTLLLLIYWYLKPDCSSYDLHTTWLLLILFFILVAMAIGRGNMVWLRSLFGLEFYSYVPAPSCCTPAMLFPKHGASDVVRYLSQVKCSRYVGKDTILDQLLQRFGKKAYLVEPNTFTHIGLYSSLHDNLVNPWKLE